MGGQARQRRRGEVVKEGEERCVREGEECVRQERRGEVCEGRRGVCEAREERRGV